MPEFCECGSLKIAGECTNRKCPKQNAESKEWIIDGKIYNFKRGITYSEAVDAVKNKSELIVVFKKPDSDHAKPWVSRE